MHEDDNSALRFWRLFEKVMTQHKSKYIVPSQREAVICRGARAQVFKIEVNEILRGAPFFFTSRPSIINIFHAKHISGGSQAIKVKVYSPSTNKHTPRLAESMGTVHTNNNPGGVLFNYLQS